MVDVANADMCLLYAYNNHKTRCKVNIMQQIRSPVVCE